MDPSAHIGNYMQADVDLAIQASLDVIAEENARLVSLKRRRNAFSHACSLPNELLGEIFCHILKATDSVSQWPRPWLTVTHVCHDWRAVAISYCGLWTDVDLAKSADLSAAFAKRARNCALDVRNYPKPETAEFETFVTSFISTHAHHIRSFEKLALSPSAHSLLVDRLDDDTCFDLLEELDFEFDGPSSTVLAFEDVALPRLRNVSCAGVPRSFLVLLPRLNLTKLEIWLPRKRQTAGTWIRALKGLEQLEFLKLVDAFKFVWAPADLPILHESRLAHFPRLHTLELHEEGIGYTLLQFFEHCCFPVTTRVFLSSTDGIRHDAFLHVASSLAAVATGRTPNNLSMPPFQSIGIENEEVSLWTAEVPVADMTVPSFAKNKSPVPTWNLRFDMEYGVQAFLAAFSFCHFRQINVDFTMPCADVETFLELRHFPTLWALFIRCRESLQAFIDAHNIVSSNPGQLLVPKLDRLVLGNVAWKKHNDPDLQRCEPSDSCLGRQLTRALSARKASGAPLKSLVHAGSLYRTDWDPASLVERGVVE